MKLDKPGGFVGRDALRGSARGRADAQAEPARARRPARGRARRRAGLGRRPRWSAGSRRAGSATRASSRSPTPTCRSTTRRPGPRPRSTCSAATSPPPSPTPAAPGLPRGRSGVDHQNGSQEEDSCDPTLWSRQRTPHGEWPLVAAMGGARGSHTGGTWITTRDLRETFPISTVELVEGSITEWISGGWRVRRAPDWPATVWTEIRTWSGRNRSRAYSTGCPDVVRAVRSINSSADPSSTLEQLAPRAARR